MIVGIGLDVEGAKVRELLAGVAAAAAILEG
jgi:hypothetical protein